jgi:hypothetical protein
VIAVPTLPATGRVEPMLDVACFDQAAAHALDRFCASAEVLGEQLVARVASPGLVVEMRERELNGER